MKTLPASVKKPTGQIILLTQCLTSYNPMPLKKVFY